MNRPPYTHALLGQRIYAWIIQRQWRRWRIQEAARRVWAEHVRNLP